MEAKWGLIPDMSASVTLRELVRIDVAKELTMTGRIVNGEEAASLGLVTRCVTDPLAEAEKLVNEIVERYVLYRIACASGIVKIAISTDRIYIVAVC
jgi:enoyl-CoA hydratase/carnithine racemase